ncbi:MAG: GAF domain-containing protein [Actinobacteria bacterium]|nr:GAF domain-containing protein [Actinomycetota bacterium]
MNFLRILAIVRLALVPLALAQLLVARGDFPDGYEAAAWIALAAQVAVGVLLLWLARGWRGRRRNLAVGGLAADTALSIALILIYSFQAGQPLRALLFLVVMEAAFFYRERGGVVMALLGIPILVGAEAWRSTQFDHDTQVESVILRVGTALALGLVIGRLVGLQAEQAALAQSRAEEAERLRDQLGRRVDHLEAANRCARALGSSLELDHAFSAFIAELRALVPFDRAAIVLAEDGSARVMATAGVAAERHLGPGTTLAVEGSTLEAVVGRGETVHRDMSEPRYSEEPGLLELGLRERVLAPLQLGAHSIGALSLARREAGSFRREEIELVTFLGRLVASAVQNIRTYDAERANAQELRRLSALRADFVSLVSHELRSPMAAVIGSARTLQQRWRELRPEQRDAFLAVIGDETSRLANLIGDVLDTSRIEAGTFGYTFDEVDLATVLRDAVAAAELGQDDVRVSTHIPAALPLVQGDGGRLRQLVDNLISNALKYSQAGTEVTVEARADDGVVKVRVSDRGPGIPREDQQLIFEKFGRASHGRDAKPGTGLGLFISRSFAEAHGGSLEVESAPGEGATFTLTLPAALGA